MYDPLRGSGKSKKTPSKPELGSVAVSISLVSIGTSLATPR